MDIHIEDFIQEAVEYVVLLEQLGLDDLDTEGEKNRAHYRFIFDAADKSIPLQIRDDTAALYDLSVGGLSFNSSKEYEVGKEIELNFDGRFYADVVIIDSLPGKAISDEGDAMIRHCAEFVLESDGFKCTTDVLKYFLDKEKAKL